MVLDFLKKKLGHPYYYGTLLGRGSFSIPPQSSLEGFCLNYVTMCIPDLMVSNYTILWGNDADLDHLMHMFQVASEHVQLH